MPRLHLRLGLYIFGALIAALALAWGARVALAALRPHGLSLPPQLAGLLATRDSVARVLAEPPAAGDTIELDAYYSGAGRAPLAALPCDADPYAILSDRPFLPELTVLGAGEANAPAGESAWLIALVPGADLSLPYHARLRGHLAAADEGCPTAARAFVVERVVHVYSQRPPEAALAAGFAGWPQHQDAEARYCVPCPPGWHVERVDAQTVMLYDPRRPSSPVLLRARAGETHHDPFDPTALPPLLQGHDWRVFDQREALGAPAAAGQGLLGYRLQGAGEAGARSLSVLFSGHGRTYELSLRYPLGLEAPQEVLSAYSAMVAGFSLEAPLAPSPTPPVQQALGAGPFLGQEEAITAACGCLEQEIDESLDLRLVPEVEARGQGGPCARFMGHASGVWALTLRTPLAARTQTLRLLLDATTGRELCRQEIEESAVPEPLAEQPPARPARWIEVDLSRQALVAWEEETAVRKFYVSTGTALHPTIAGEFHIYYKTRSMDMRGTDYFLPGVPNVMLFFEGYALHGAYWHFSFGTPISHGCVNMTLPDAAWLFNWAGPRLADDEWAARSTVCNPGTPVVVHY